MIDFSRCYRFIKMLERLGMSEAPIKRALLLIRSILLWRELLLRVNCCAVLCVVPIFYFGGLHFLPLLSCLSSQSRAERQWNEAQGLQPDLPERKLRPLSLMLFTNKVTLGALHFAVTPSLMPMFDGGIEPKSARHRAWRPSGMVN